MTSAVVRIGSSSVRVGLRNKPQRRGLGGLCDGGCSERGWRGEHRSGGGNELTAFHLAVFHFLPPYCATIGCGDKLIRQCPLLRVRPAREMSGEPLHLSGYNILAAALMRPWSKTTQAW